MPTCHHCGAPIIREARKGGLLVRTEPPGAFWRGKRLDLTPRDLAMLFQLAADRGSLVALELLCTREGSVSDTIRPRICRLRAKLAEVGAALRIVTETGWGYRLEEA